MVLKHLAKSPPSLTRETSPVCQVCRSVSRSFASQPRKPPSQSSRRNASRFGYFPSCRCPCCLNHCDSYRRQLYLLLCLATWWQIKKGDTYSLAVRPRAVHPPERTFPDFWLGLVMPTIEVFGSHQRGFRSFQETSRRPMS